MCSCAQRGAPWAADHCPCSPTLTCFTPGDLCPQLLQLMPDLVGQPLQCFPPPPTPPPHHHPTTPPPHHPPPQVALNSLSTRASPTGHPTREAGVWETVRDQCRCQYILIPFCPIISGSALPMSPSLFAFSLPDYQPCGLQPSIS